MSAPRYLCLLAASCLVTLGAAAVFNAAVDPYGVFGAPAIAGLNAFKSQAGQRGATFKTHGVAAVRPKALILGNSRAEVGFDPKHPSWPAGSRPVYNGALPGTGPGVALDLFAHALAVGELRRVVLGVDFLDFLVRPDESILPARPRALLAPASHARDMFTASVSADALLDSLATIRAQPRPDASGLTPLGFNPMREYATIARVDGYEAMFRQRNLDNARRLVRGPHAILPTGSRTSTEFETVRAILRLAAAHGCRVELVVYPYHAQLLVLMQEAGLWPVYGAWLEHLARLVEEERARDPRLAAALWDFSAPSRWTSEAVPERGGPRFEVRDYWEAGHFKNSLGDQVLARVLSPAGTPESFGTVLDAAGVPGHFARSTAALAEYRANHPRVAQELAAMIGAERSVALAQR